ncbi:MAG TPA: HDOD domain-containing protein [Bryobacterales bacterium]|nr:HDOD domain-containing protein [Bryobacterales bacterium]
MGVPQALVQQAAPLGERRIQQAIARLQALPAFYPTVQKALRLIADPLSGNSHIQQVISTDQAISARILELANSAYFGHYSEVRTLSLALTLVGREKLATVLRRFLSEELLSMLSGRKPAASHIREMSVATAAVAHAMAERLVRSDKEELLLAGLLHNIGELVLLSQFRDQYEQMLRLGDRLPRAEAEKAAFGVESGLVGKWLLEAWSFPPLFPALIERLADPWSANFPEAPLTAIAIVYTARQLAEHWIADDRPATPAAPQAEAFAQSLPARLLSTLEVDGQFLADLYVQLPGELARISEVLL